MFKFSYLHRVFLFKWFKTLSYLFYSVRVSPSVLLSGNPRFFQFKKGVKVNQKCNLQIIDKGTITLFEDVWLAKEVELETSSNITIGRGTTIQRRCTINGTVLIGSECILAPNVFISSGTHPFRIYPRLTIRNQERKLIEENGNLDFLHKPVSIGDDCWLGANVVVCPGVKIGDGVVVGANSVVTKDVSSNTVVAGVPCREIGKR